MFSHRIESNLSQVEQFLEDVSTALLAGDPVVLESASAVLRKGVANLSILMQAPAASAHLDDAMRRRFAHISHVLSQQRSNLLRRAVVVDRALATVLPQSVQPQVYGGGGKTAAYRGGAARIYAAVAT